MELASNPIKATACPMPTPFLRLDLSSELRLALNSGAPPPSPDLVYLLPGLSLPVEHKRAYSALSTVPGLALQTELAYSTEPNKCPRVLLLSHFVYHLEKVTTNVCNVMYVIYVMYVMGAGEVHTGDLR